MRCPFYTFNLVRYLLRKQRPQNMALGFLLWLGAFPLRLSNPYLESRPGLYGGMGRPASSSPAERPASTGCALQAKSSSTTFEERYCAILGRKLVRRRGGLNSRLFELGSHWSALGTLRFNVKNIKNRYFLDSQNKIAIDRKSLCTSSYAREY